MARRDDAEGAIDRAREDTDRANNPSEPADPRVLDEAADRPVHQSRGFPSGGAPGGVPAAPGTAGKEADGDGKG